MGHHLRRRFNSSQSKELLEKQNAEEEISDIDDSESTSQSSPRSRFPVPEPSLAAASTRNSFIRRHSLAGDQQDAENDEINGLLDGVQISNLDKIDYPGLIKDMHERFKKKAVKWENLANRYSRCSLILNFGVLVMQMVQMLAIQFMDIFDNSSSRNGRVSTEKGLSKFTIPRLRFYRRSQDFTQDHNDQDQTRSNDTQMTIWPYWIQALQCVLAALSGLFIGLQMKLKLVQKADKYRRGAKVYGRLRRTSVYYLMLLENGGKVDDITNLWHSAMLQEGRNIPCVKSYVLS